MSMVLHGLRFYRTNITPVAERPAHPALVGGFAGGIIPASIALEPSSRAMVYRYRRHCPPGRQPDW